VKYFVLIVCENMSDLLAQKLKEGNKLVERKFFGTFWRLISLLVFARLKTSN
jgi:hypothetical protein